MRNLPQGELNKVLRAIKKVIGNKEEGDKTFYAKSTKDALEGLSLNGEMNGRKFRDVLARLHNQHIIRRFHNGESIEIRLPE